MSCQRRCDIFLATDQNWYMLLGDFEYAEDTCDCTFYGRFSSEEDTLKYLHRAHSNPGGSNTDNSGKRPPPKEFTDHRKRYC